MQKSCTQGGTSDYVIVVDLSFIWQIQVVQPWPHAQKMLGLNAYNRGRYFNPYLNRKKRLTADKLYLIQPSTSSSDGILWCEIVVSSFFSEYFFEGLKPEDYPNEEIILEMPTDDFHRALKIDRPDKTIPTTLKLKLSREDFAAGQKRAHETTVGGSKQPVIVIQLNLQQASTGRDSRTQASTEGFSSTCPSPSTFF